jgi:hypothetical protein
VLATLGLEYKALDPRKCAEVLRKAETRKLETFFKKETRDDTETNSTNF